MLDYSEKGLDESVQARIEEHLQNCDDCAQELHAFKQTVRLLESVPLREPPEAFWNDFTTNVMHKVNGMEVPSRRRWSFSWPRFRPAMVFGVLALLVVGGAFAYFSPAIHQKLTPLMKMAGLTTETAPERELPGVGHAEVDLEKALQQIASEDLMHDILESEMALFDTDAGLPVELYYPDDTLNLLISSLTDAEKQALLDELHKMKNELRRQ